MGSQSSSVQGQYHLNLGSDENVVHISHMYYSCFLIFFPKLPRFPFNIATFLFTLTNTYHAEILDTENTQNAALEHKNVT